MLFKRLKNMSQKNQARHQMKVESTAVIAAECINQNVPSKKRKEEAKQALYLNRI